MDVKYRLIWADEAKADLQNIYDFIHDKWSLKEAEHFLDRVKEFEDIIRMYPESFKSSSSVEGVRLGFIHRNTTAVNRVIQGPIEILSLFDNREDEDFRG